MKNERRFIIVQVLKDKARQSIRESALKIFKESGYQKASMRTIAEGAGMSVGNLYRYYKNKDALFGELVQPMIQFFIKGQQHQPKMNLDMIDVNLLEHSVFVEQLIAARLDFRDELFVLFLRADGSPFEGARQTLQGFMETQAIAFLEENDFSTKKIFKGSTFVKSTTSGLVEGFCTILEESTTEQDFLINMLEFMELLVKPALRNLFAIRDNQTQFRRISDEEIIRHFNSHSHRRDFSCSESNGGD